ncbi:MAG TPA: hypothetical protein VK663_02245 [Burkholderiales bacterium]|nr:hypothetical protein [Burkholderiales bacterium]
MKLVFIRLGVMGGPIAGHLAKSAAYCRLDTSSLIKLPRDTHHG